jgi:hypothetical protein
MFFAKYSHYDDQIKEDEMAGMNEKNEKHVAA